MRASDSIWPRLLKTNRRIEGLTPIFCLSAGRLPPDRLHILCLVSNARRLALALQVAPVQVLNKLLVGAPARYVLTGQKQLVA